MIVTERLTLVPGTLALIRAEIGDREAFAGLLGASVPAAWPPETTVDALPLFLGWLEAAPDRVGWFGWYALARIDDTAPPTLIGGGGFLGPPEAGAVQIGYSVLADYQRQGYATEIVRALVRWALTQPGVDCVKAETEWANPESARVLAKTGFEVVGPGAQPGGTQFERRPPV